MALLIRIFLLIFTPKLAIASYDYVIVGGGATGCSPAGMTRIILKSEDSQLFKVDEPVARQIKLVDDRIQAGDAGEIHVPLRGEILEKILVYAQYHFEDREMKRRTSSVIVSSVVPEEKEVVDVDSEKKIALKEEDEGEGTKKSEEVSTETWDDDSRKWNKEFMKVDRMTVIDIVNAAHLLQYDDLLDLSCQTLGDLLRGKTVDEIRKMFNIENDYEKSRIEK